MKTVPIGNQWRTGLWVILGLLLLTRIFTLSAFPIFNDEAIYLRYSQQIHGDFEKNKFISMNGEFTDWKPPLQYWMAAPFVGLGDDPLIAGRIVSLITSIIGFFGFYLFSKALFTEREGVLTALLYVLCPPVLFHNNQFTAETFLFSTAPLLYCSLLKAMQGRENWIWAITAAALGTALLLFKQSGFLLLVVSAFLPLVRLRRKEDANRGPMRQLARDVLLVIAVITISLLAAELFLPAEFNATRDHFNKRWILSLRELGAVPVNIWRQNLSVVAEYISSNYSWVAILFLGLLSWVAVRKKSFPEIALVLMCVAGATGVVFLLRGFNEYVFHTAVVAVLLPLLARTGFVINDFARKGSDGLFRGALLFCAGLTLLYWGYQDVLMGVSPGKSIERGSRWAIANYLKSWSTGFGIKELVTMLEKEKGLGIVFTDAQWGNPGTALEVYRSKRFPNLHLVPISREFLDPSESRKLTDDARKIESSHFAIFSSDSSGSRRQWLGNVEREMCQTRTEIRAYPGQTPIIVCRF